MWTKYMIAQSLRTARLEKELTQADLAEIADVSANSIAKWESGLSYPESGTLCRLCNALGCTPNDLLWGKEECE